MARTKQNKNAYLLPEPPEDIQLLFEQNPKGKKRNLDLIRELAIQVRTHHLVIWVVGTLGADGTILIRATLEYPKLSKKP